MASPPPLAPRLLLPAPDPQTTAMTDSNIPSELLPTLPQGTIVSTGHRIARKPQDVWARIKMPFITLYRTENRPLKEVMEILERDHGFRAK